ncbi:LysR family transcriptional regulator [Loigolactobacillus binensis]|uniref:LysR family transcriptional regulator n=1 Tax=Loigolactobacillus binensis TaxID=2559922 RepID=A0ABW3EFA8_9LACO|nr:LysR family transcriptional regulator [Loigolactobacillus binensis]
MLDKKMHTFALLAQTKSYTVTAQRLYLTQPAVTQQIKSLESELGLQLVSYQHAHLTITPAGQQLASYINKIDHESQKLLTQLKLPNQQTPIRLGCTRSLSSFLLTHVLQQLHAKSQQIRCQIANTDTILKALTAGNIDFGLVEGNFDKTRFAFVTLRQEPFIGITYADNPLLTGQPLTLAQLLSQTLLVREPGSGTREIFQNWLTMHNAQIKDFQQVIEIATPTPIIQLLTTGCGISFMYRSLVSAELASGQLVQLPVRGFELQHEINLVYLKNSYFAAQYQAIAAHV